MHGITAETFVDYTDDIDSGIGPEADIVVFDVINADQLPLVINTVVLMI